MTSLSSESSEDKIEEDFVILARADKANGVSAESEAGKPPGAPPTKPPAESRAHWCLQVQDPLRPPQGAPHELQPNMPLGRGSCGDLREASPLPEDHGHAAINNLNQGRSDTCILDPAHADRAQRRSRSMSKIQGEVKGGSRSGSEVQVDDIRLEEERGCGFSDQDSDVSMVKGHTMSDQHFKDLSAESSSEDGQGFSGESKMLSDSQLKDSPSQAEGVWETGTGGDVSPLVGGLDSLIKAMCRSLTKLHVIFHGSPDTSDLRSPQSASQPFSSTQKEAAPSPPLDDKANLRQAESNPSAAKARGALYEIGVRKTGAAPQAGDLPQRLTLQEKFKRKVFYTRSLPLLMGTRRRDEEPVNGGQISQASSDSGGEEKEEGGWGAAASREVQHMLEQSAVLQAMWRNHTLQLRDALLTRRREASQAESVEQALTRARHMIRSLKQQRQAVHKCLEHKEEEMAQVLKRHKTENALLRKKVLAYLQDKKNSLAEWKSGEDGQLWVLVNNLLSLHLNREHFMALDLAKQSKINELKLLVVRQQLAMQELLEDNAELNHALNKLMQFLPDGGSSAQPNLPRAAGGGACRAGRSSGRGMALSDVLHCERSLYLPNTSTSPELAAVSVFGVGAVESSPTCPPEEVFDASRQRCQADGDHPSGSAEDLPQQLLRQLTLQGPGSPGFTLTDLHQ